MLSVVESLRPRVPCVESFSVCQSGHTLSMEIIIYMHPLAYALRFTLEWDNNKERFSRVSLDTMVEMFKARYWNPLDCADFNRNYSCCLFDAGVDLGVSLAKEFHRKAQGDIRKLNEERAIHYLSMKDIEKRNAGMKRLNELKKYIDSE